MSKPKMDLIMDLITQQLIKREAVPSHCVKQRFGEIAKSKDGEVVPTGMPASYTSHF